MYTLFGLHVLFAEQHNLQKKIHVRDERAEEKLEQMTVEQILRLKLR